MNAEKLAKASPGQIRQLARTGQLTGPTAGMAGGFAQANLVILPGSVAADFAAFCAANPAPCPVLEVVRGTPETKLMAQAADITTDFPRYRVYRDGQLVAEPTSVAEYWQADFTGFLLGCSFSFEEALQQAGIEIRHQVLGTNVPMYRTNRQLVSKGVFSGPLVVSMRPMKPAQVATAYAVTGKFPLVHGAPVHHGDPAALGIADIAQPDYGDPPELREGEVPVFWACGVTPQAVLAAAKLPFAITHAPGHMLVLDIKNSELNEVLAAKKN